MATTSPIYLDYAATTPIRDEVAAAMRPYYEDRWANASALYSAGREARKGIEEARERVAASVGARPDEIVFTGGGTEADNLALKGAAWAGRDRGSDGVVVSAIEHHAVLDSAHWLARHGFRVTEVPVDRDGIVRLDALESAVDERTAVVSVMWANNEVGSVQPVADIGATVRAAGAVFHTDAVQAMPWLDVDAGAADAIALSAHKIGGPKGAGALVLRRGVGLQGVLHGGGQERGLRSGTYNVAGIVGLGVACAATAAERDEVAARVAGLRERLVSLLAERVGGVTVNGHPTERLANNCNVSIDGVEGESLLLLLDGAGVAASIGSACQSGSADPSHVLVAMGVPRTRALGTLRLTLGRDTTAAEVDEAVARIAAAVERLRR